jgi:hypothetical protein
VFKTRTLTYLGIIAISAAIVALGAEEFRRNHESKLSQIEVNRVQSMITGFRGVNDFERASFSAERYQDLAKQAKPSRPSLQDSIKKDLNAIKSWVGDKFFRPTESQDISEQ